MSEKFQNNIPDQLVYGNDILELTVLGGIRLEGLDRMRATVKVQLQESSRPPIRHNFREVQYRAGHRYVSSTENYLVNDLEDLQEDINKYHPIG